MTERAAARMPTNASSCRQQLKQHFQLQQLLLRLALLLQKIGNLRNDFSVPDVFQLLSVVNFRGS
jgi:hypothetical protein